MTMIKLFSANDEPLTRDYFDIKTGKTILLQIDIKMTLQDLTRPRRLLTNKMKHYKMSIPQ